ncbi:efflux RND transporter periplasmic adaptor subunit [Acidaminobacter hydrogenoformans]|uniref:Membrane fusion protein, macrolide-specific efflux system n=1 Tax=Acidaminobacter hydrogenoformans DSM 2784 TaxID=1120920 RepID=A0A1G5S7Z7_9FIRM|nr:efflux RND transporter periplasmic adaptor subunit [Acidaminobacter hydrogenoformans]SCZ81841.1 membrane fusion protein, macrolide-specific efflux system [Acidaminobacter hydrogenoformans DSM 2784]
MNKKLIKILIAFAVIAAVGYGGYAYFTGKDQAEVPVQTYREVTVKQGDISISFDSEGAAELSVTTLKFPVSGQLSEVRVAPGAHVLAGEVLAVLEDDALAAKLDAARLSYSQAVVRLEKTKDQYASSLVSERAKLEALSFQLENARRDYESMAAIPEAFPAYDVETKRLAYENAKVAYDAAASSYAQLTKGSQDVSLDQLGVQQAAAAVEEAQRAISDLSLKAPADGLVLTLGSKVGETVSSTSDFVQLGDPAGLSIASLVSELDIASVELGQLAEVEFEALEGQSFKGQVLSIDPVAQTNASGLINYTVRITLDELSDKVMDGMTCSVSYILRKKENVLIIPNASVKMVDGKQTVEVKTEAGEIMAKQVSTGLTDGFNVEVLSGLEAGEVVLIRQN